MNASGWDPAQVRKARAEKAEAERREMAAILVVLDPKTAQKMAHASLEVLRSVLAKQVADKSRPPAGAGPVTLGTPRALPVRATVGRSAAPSSTPQGAEMDRRMGIRPGGLAIVDEGSRLVFATTKPGSVRAAPAALPVRATVATTSPSSTPQGAEMDRRMGIRPGGLAIVDEGSRLVFATTKPGSVRAAPAALPVRATVATTSPSSTPQGAEMDRRMGIRPGGLAIVDEGSRLVFATTNARAERAHTKAAS